MAFPLPLLCGFQGLTWGHSLCGKCFTPVWIKYNVWAGMGADINPGTLIDLSNGNWCVLCVSSRPKLMYRLRIPYWEFLEPNVFQLVDFLQFGNI